jgi:hypothetical protein
VPHPAAPPAAPEEPRADGGRAGGDARDGNGDDAEDEPADALRPVRPGDVYAVLDDNDQAEAFDGNVDDSGPGAMGVYRRAVFARIKLECSAAHTVADDGEKWLLGMLRAPGADWWLRRWRAPDVCARLAIAYGEPAASETAPSATDDGATAAAAASGATAGTTAADAASGLQMTRSAAAAANTAAVAIAAAAANVPPLAEGDGASAAAAATAAAATAAMGVIRAVTAATANSGAPGSDDAAATRAAALARLFPPIGFAPCLPRPKERMRRAIDAPPLLVGCAAIGGAPPPPPLEQQQPRGSGKRGPNRAPRAPPHCKRCKSLGRSEEEQRTCRGAKGKGGRECAVFFLRSNGLA